MDGTEIPLVEAPGGTSSLVGPQHKQSTAQVLAPGSATNGPMLWQQQQLCNLNYQQGG